MEQRWCVDSTVAPVHHVLSGELSGMKNKLFVAHLFGVIAAVVTEGDKVTIRR